MSTLFVQVNAQNEQISVDEVKKSLYNKNEKRGDNLEIGNRIAELRKEKGVSRVQFAQQIGIPSTTLRNYETGVREPGHSFIVQMAKEFNVSTDYLLGLTDNRSPNETKKSPEPAVTDSEDGKDVIVKILTEGLSRLGYLDEEGMISDRDFKFLRTLVDLISDHFEKD